MAQRPDFLHEEYTIETPENVAFGYAVAGIGSRSIGALLDALLLGVALLVVNVVLLVLLAALGDLDRLDGAAAGRAAPSWLGGLALALYALVNFALLWGYFVVFELLWNGQTPGKRVAGIRVVRLDSSPAGALAIVVRNLVRLIDFLPAAYGVGLLTMFIDRRSRRLGDLAAGTLVIRERREIALATLQPAAAPAAPDPAAAERLDALAREYHRLRALSAADYDLIVEALGRRARGAIDDALLARLAAALAARLGGPTPADARQFLMDLAAHYRRPAR
jgi:uncharacterized RDD family membrane protein YckC